MNRLFVFEGLSGAGKSTVGAMLARAIGAAIYKTPAGLFGTIRSAVDDHATLEARFLFYMAGVLQASQEIAKLLETSDVVCDRYLLTTVCWHQTIGVDTTAVEAFALPHLVVPDFTFLITTTDDARHRRMDSRTEGRTVNDRNEAKGDLEKRFLANYLGRNPILIDNSTNDPKDALQRILAIIR